MAIARTSMRTTKLNEMNSNFKHCCSLDIVLGCFEKICYLYTKSTLQVNKKNIHGLYIYVYKCKVHG